MCSYSSSVYIVAFLNPKFPRVTNSMAYGTWRFDKGSPIIPILSQINPIPRIDTYFLRSILILSSHLRLGYSNRLFPVGLPDKLLKALLPSSILATWPAHLNIRWTVQTMRFLGAIITYLKSILKGIYIIFMKYFGYRKQY